MEYLWNVKCWHLCIKQDQLIEWINKRQAMALSVNVLWYNKFMLWQQSPILWETSWYSNIQKPVAANVIPCRIAIHSTYIDTALNSTKHSQTYLGYSGGILESHTELINRIYYITKDHIAMHPTLL